MPKIKSSTTSSVKKSPAITSPTSATERLRFALAILRENKVGNTHLETVFDAKSGKQVTRFNNSRDVTEENRKAIGTFLYKTIAEAKNEQANGHLAIFEAENFTTALHYLTFTHLTEATECEIFYTARDPQLLAAYWKHNKEPKNGSRVREFTNSSSIFTHLTPSAQYEMFEGFVRVPVAHDKALLRPTGYLARPGDNTAGTYFRLCAAPLDARPMVLPKDFFKVVQDQHVSRIEHWINPSQTDDQFANDQASYQLEGTAQRSVFTLDTIVTHPDNLVHQKADGSYEVWIKKNTWQHARITKQGNLAGRWEESADPYVFVEPKPLGSAQEKVASTKHVQFAKLAQEACIKVESFENKRGVYWQQDIGTTKRTVNLAHDDPVEAQEYFELLLKDSDKELCGLYFDDGATIEDEHYTGFNQRFGFHKSMLPVLRDCRFNPVELDQIFAQRVDKREIGSRAFIEQLAQFKENVQYYVLFTQRIFGEDSHMFSPHPYFEAGACSAPGPLVLDNFKQYQIEKRYEKSIMALRKNRASLGLILGEIDGTRERYIKLVYREGDETNPHSLTKSQARAHLRDAIIKLENYYETNSWHAQMAMCCVNWFNTGGVQMPTKEIKEIKKELVHIKELVEHNQELTKKLYSFLPVTACDADGTLEVLKKEGELVVPDQYLVVMRPPRFERPVITERVESAELPRAATPQTVAIVDHPIPKLPSIESLLAGGIDYEAINREIDALVFPEPPIHTEPVNISVDDLAPPQEP
jgi:hypothetical protein